MKLNHFGALVLKLNMNVKKRGMFALRNYDYKAEFIFFLIKKGL